LSRPGRERAGRPALDKKSRRVLRIQYVLHFGCAKEGTIMKDIHETLTVLKKEFPRVYETHEALGKEIHEGSGPIPEKTRWLIKIAISGAAGHRLSLETHIAKGREAGLTDAEIKQALLLLIPTAGFPTFMEAYSVYLAGAG
jgi:AhpD family alkylhydroperoxidase